MSLKLIPLPFETAALTGFTHKTIVEYSDIVTQGGANTTATFQIVPRNGSTGTAPAGMICERTAINLITAFDASDATINSLLIELGDGVDPNRFFGQTQIAVDGTEILFQIVPQSVDTQPYALLAADTIDLKFTVAGGSDPTCAELTSGKVEVYFRLINLNDLEKVT